MKYGVQRGKMMSVFGFYDYKPKIFQELSCHLEFYIALYMSSVNEYIDFSEHVGVLFSIQLWIDTLSDTWLDVDTLVFT